MKFERLKQQRLASSITYIKVAKLISDLLILLIHRYLYFFALILRVKVINIYYFPLTYRLIYEKKIEKIKLYFLDLSLEKKRF